MLWQLCPGGFPHKNRGVPLGKEPLRGAKILFCGRCSNLKQHIIFNSDKDDHERNKTTYQLIFKYFLDICSFSQHPKRYYASFSCGPLEAEHPKWHLKVGFYLKAVFPSRNLGSMWISRSSWNISFAFHWSNRKTVHSSHESMFCGVLQIFGWFLGIFGRR